MERTTRFCLLLHLPSGYDAVAVRDAMIPTIHILLTALKRLLTWGRGTELARHTADHLAAHLNDRPRKHSTGSAQRNTQPATVLTGHVATTT